MSASKTKTTKKKAAPAKKAAGSKGKISPHFQLHPNGGLPACVLGPLFNCITKKYRTGSANVAGTESMCNGHRYFTSYNPSDETFNIHVRPFAHRKEQLDREIPGLNTEVMKVKARIENLKFAKLPAEEHEEAMSKYSEELSVAEHRFDKAVKELKSYPAPYTLGVKLNDWGGTSEYVVEAFTGGEGEKLQ